MGTRIGLGLGALGIGAWLLVAAYQTQQRAPIPADAGYSDPGLLYGLILLVAGVALLTPARSSR